MTDRRGTTTPLLELHGISKSFGSVQALSDVEFEVMPGEVMALVGDNGAGKSTLIKCVAGTHSPDSGEIVFDGETVHIHGPKDAAKLGIEVVYQDLALCDNLDVVQNMYLGREARDWLHRLKEPVMEAKTAETMKGLAVTTIRSIRQPVATLSGGQRQSVAVARAVMWNSRLVILDEPTAALGVAQTQQVLELVERLAEQGLAVVLISHNLHDIFEVAHRITVLRLGRNVAVYEREQDDAAGGRLRRSRPAFRRRSPGSRRRSRSPREHGRDGRRSRSRARESFFGRTLDNIRGGTLGSWPVLIGLAVIVIFFSFKAENFLSPGNFSNIITQMAGTTLLAYGVVFVLLIGEIDLSISYISGIAGVVVAKLTVPDGNEVAGIVAILLAVAVVRVDRRVPGVVRRLHRRAGVRGHARRLSDLAGRDPEVDRGRGRDRDPGQRRSTTPPTTSSRRRPAGSSPPSSSASTSRSIVSTFVSHRRHGVAVRDPWLLVAKVVVVVAATVFVVVVSNRDRGVPFVLLLMIASLLVLTFVAKRTTFGRHVYAVGGNAEAARRAGINVARVRLIVFMISGAMAGLGGVVLAARLNSVDLNAGGGTLLIDAIAAAVIGGTSLFGGRGEVKDALFGALVIATIANGLNTLNLTQGVIFITTGCILLFAVTLDTILRRRQRKAGR